MIMCRSIALDALRREQASGRSSSTDTDHESNAPPPEDLLQATQRDSAVHRALAQLNENERQLLSLAFFGDHTHADLARITGLPLGTVKSRVRRGLRILRAYVAK